ncbi:VOC family protein [Streptomyces sp. RS10V-4]|uniref:VOC family protein n=1 Tax=Streptomyces rhizoryzae TaxID=2932493 RepID=UPI002003D729|nr:VOC family protein [Streptomyces rhizoryzae]MCK7625279.1 VOC family protein [Streptomyces rhizoryzae]
MPATQPRTVSTASLGGAPCWVSLMTHDLQAAQDFYGEVLGWHFRPGVLGPEFSIALAEGQPVAGLGALGPSWRVAVAWTPYFAVANANDTAARIRERGATVAVGPLEFGKGRAALAADRDGAVFGLWEGQTLSWAVGQGCAPMCLELRTRDAFEAAIFYGEVFGWSPDRPGGCDITYEHDEVVVRDAGGRTVAALRGGAVEAAPDPHVRPRWHVYFPVHDIEKVTAAAVAAGGFALPVTPMVDSTGCEAVIRDPQGGLFTVATTQD